MNISELTKELKINKKYLSTINKEYKIKKLNFNLKEKELFNLLLSKLEVDKIKIKLYTNNCIYLYFDKYIFNLKLNLDKNNIMVKIKHNTTYNYQNINNLLITNSKIDIILNNINNQVVTDTFKNILLNNNEYIKTKRYYDNIIRKCNKKIDKLNEKIKFKKYEKGLSVNMEFRLHNNYLYAYWELSRNSLIRKSLTDNTIYKIKNITKNFYDIEIVPPEQKVDNIAIEKTDFYRELLYNREGYYIDFNTVSDSRLFRLNLMKDSDE
jgi:hypothetical protein